MIADVVEREILIQAPPETVWRVVTESSQIAQWLSDSAELDPRPGGEGVLAFGDQAAPYVVRMRVEAAEPPHRFAFRWDYPDGEQPATGNSLRVEFNLAAEGTGTRLRVTESGFAALRQPDQDKAARYESHAKGWEVRLGRLQDHASQPA